MLIIPAGVVAVSVLGHRTCFPTPCPASKDTIKLAVRPGELSIAYAGTCTARGKQASGSPDTPITRRCVCPDIHKPADAKRLYRSAAPSIWLRMTPHTQPDGTSKAIPLVPICSVPNNANRGAPNGTSLYSAARSKHAESLMDDGDGEVGYVNPPKYRRRRMRQTNAPNEWAAADQACSGSAASSASPSASSSSLFRPKSTGEELFSHGSSHGS